jgi:ABC-type multidrug transport system fused ATPase/permease subunit
LTRIVEICGGKIFIDGVDIKEVDIDYLREKITIIPQDATMFNETLRFNIDPYGKCTDEEIVQLLKRAGLEKLLEREGGENEKQQLNQQITEGGGNLSSGEKQLICICRAVLRKN